MSARPDAPLFIGIDVGTGSARAGVFDAHGRLLASATRAIQLFRPQDDFAEQSSDDIWGAVCQACREAVQSAGARPQRVGGVGFDATCSLVALDRDDRPVTVSPTGNDTQNVIVWMDHRAADQTRRVNQTGHEVLRYVGGSVSIEMQTPKLLWLKENLPQSWDRAARFFDLPDYLTFRATAADVRSLCSTVCKWTYLGHDGGGWSESFFRAAGLGDLADDGFARIGRRVRPMGEPIPGGLAAGAAAELGLAPGTAVGVSIIDAHAGGLGVLGMSLPGDAQEAGVGAAAGGANDVFDRRVALIGGTSSCHMAVSRTARFVPGVWGPYYSAMIPGCWLNEGGQSATGALIDHVILTHPRGAALADETRHSGRSPYDLLNARLAELAAGAPFPAALTRDLHVLPYFHGNRSPRADPSLRGMISGLSLGDSLDGLALLYLATVQAIAHGTRHILDALDQHGYRIDTILACGGGTKNAVFLREHADVTGRRIVLAREPEAVLLGSAMLGATAAGHYATVAEAMRSMSAAGSILEPAGGAVREYHAAKHRVFHRMYDDFLAYRRMMTTEAR